MFNFFKNKRIFSSLNNHESHARDKEKSKQENTGELDDDESIGPPPKAESLENQLNPYFYSLTIDMHNPLYHLALARVYYLNGHSMEANEWLTNARKKGLDKKYLKAFTHDIQKPDKRFSTFILLAKNLLKNFPQDFPDIVQAFTSVQTAQVCLQEVAKYRKLDNSEQKLLTQASNTLIQLEPLLKELAIFKLNKKRTIDFIDMLAIGIIYIAYQLPDVGYTCFENASRKREPSEDEKALLNEIRDTCKSHQTVKALEKIVNEYEKKIANEERVAKEYVNNLQKMIVCLKAANNLFPNNNNDIKSSLIKAEIKLKNALDIKRIATSFNKAALMRNNCLDIVALAIIYHWKGEIVMAKNYFKQVTTSETLSFISFMKRRCKESHYSQALVDLVNVYKLNSSDETLGGDKIMITTCLNLATEIDENNFVAKELISKINFNGPDTAHSESNKNIPPMVCSL